MNINDARILVYTKHFIQNFKTEAPAAAPEADITAEDTVTVADLAAAHLADSVADITAEVTATAADQAAAPLPDGDDKTVEKTTSE